MGICSSQHLYHYLMGEGDALASILAQGLLPLSAMPENERWRQSEPFYRGLYAQMAEPVLGKPFTNSGVFLTPIDFRCIPDSPMARLGRIALPVSRLELTESLLTYELDGHRLVERCTPEGLERTAALWSTEMVQSWFGRNPQMLFFHVPQVAIFPERAIPVEPAWVEGGPA